MTNQIALMLLVRAAIQAVRVSFQGLGEISFQGQAKEIKSATGSEGPAPTRLTVDRRTFESDAGNSEEQRIFVQEVVNSGRVQDKRVPLQDCLELFVRPQNTLYIK